MWRMAKTGKRSIFVAVSESKHEGELFYLHCKPMGDCNHSALDFYTCLSTVLRLWCIRHCTNTPGAWILVPECWQPKSTVQVFHLQNSSLQMLTRQLQELQRSRYCPAGREAAPWKFKQFTQDWKKSVSKLGIKSRRFCQNKIHASIPLISVRK